MFRRPSLTIILLTRQLLVRADFAGKRLAAVWQEARPPLEDLPSFVEAGLFLGGKPGRNVVVLCADFWTQTLAMNARSTAHLSAADLSQALGFEVETLSGLGALDSIIGHVETSAPKSDERGFWVVQVPGIDRDAIDSIVRLAGARLLGLAHPGGLPAPLTISASAGSWQRVELWPNLVVCLHQEHGQRPEVHLINADPDQGRWHDEEETWRNRFPPAQRREMILTTGEIVSFGSDGQPVMQHSPEEALKLWLTAWAAQVQARPPAVPLVRPAPKPVPSSMIAGIAAGLAVAAALLCYAHSWAVELLQLRPARAEVKRLEEPQRLLTQLDQRIAQLDKEQVALSKEVDGLRQVNNALLAQRQRLARLLGALADLPADDLFVQRIEGDAGQPTIHGLCLKENQANQLATRLAKTLAGDWTVKETRLKANIVLADGGPFAFQLHLKMIPPAGSAAPIASPTGRRVFEQ